MTYFGVRQRLQDRLTAILDTKIDLSDEDMQRPAVRETYQAYRVYAFATVPASCLPHLCSNNELSIGNIDFFCSIYTM